MSNNMRLWDSVFKTDPAAVKPITGKPYRGNSPKPYYLIQKATETFGPVGIGWGLTVKSERFEKVTDTDVLHVAVVSVWYVLDGVRSETFDQMGGTKAAYATSDGKKMIVDEDAGKKSVTDAMTKCLSMIGFAGDIFSGRWDDSKYVEHLQEEFRDERDKKLLAQAKERAMKTLSEAAKMGMGHLEAAWKRATPAERDLCKSELNNLKAEANNAGSHGSPAKP